MLIMLANAGRTIAPFSHNRIVGSNSSFHGVRPNVSHALYSPFTSAGMPAASPPETTSEIHMFG